MCSAFRNADGSDVIVVINYGNEPETISIGGVEPGEWKEYRTSDADGESLSFTGKLPDLGAVAIPPRSVTTLVGPSRQR